MHEDGGDHVLVHVVKTGDLAVAEAVVGELRGPDAVLALVARGDVAVGLDGVTQSIGVEGTVLVGNGNGGAADSCDLRLSCLWI